MLRLTAEGKGSGYLAIQRWLHEADVMANKSVTYEICGWGVIDLRTPFLSAAIERGIDIRVWADYGEEYMTTRNASADARKPF